MQTPSNVSLDDFLALRDHWVMEHCELQRCRTCRTEVKLARVYFSIHDRRLGDSCAVVRNVMLGVPYCRQCESHPAERGCLYIVRSGRGTQLMDLYEANRARHPIS